MSGVVLRAGKTSLKKKIQFLTSWSLQTSEKLYIYKKQMVDQMAVIVISSTEK